MSVRDQVIEIAKAELGAAAPSESAQLADSLDSVQRLQLVVAIEDHFEICFEPEDDEAVHTLDDVARVVTERLSDGA
ncbi:MAG: acyl carrier protein [Myxococcota bacterium]|jgi:acyl carrier protein